jgi:L-aspartate oxidase
VLATGGIGHLSRGHNNPPQACGIGPRHRGTCGRRLADIEFVQFHPTAIATGHDPAPLASEALCAKAPFGQWCRRAIHAQGPSDGDLAPRDVVARGVFAEIAAGRGAFSMLAQQSGRIS